ncbi:MAG: hypothetical protein U1E02_06865 [Hydrogenophaga sp.]|nr:hypothetical protein [Hydrogenophaga sp.]
MKCKKVGNVYYINNFTKDDAINAEIKALKAQIELINAKTELINIETERINIENEIKYKKLADLELKLNKLIKELDATKPTINN